MIHALSDPRRPPNRRRGRHLLATVAVLAALCCGTVGAQEPQPDAPEPVAELQMNFRGAAIDTVLDYLSEAGGFVVIREGSIPGSIDIVSHKPMSPEEAVQVLQAILIDRGYGVVRNDRILRIVKRSDAKLHDLPVATGRDPSALPRDGQLITQVVPIRHSTASKLIDTLRPLLPPDTTISANDESNALVITDTRTNVRRLMEIVSALDHAVADLLEIAVIPLRYASPADTATIINNIYEEPARTSDQQNPFAFRRGGFGGFGGRGGGEQEPSASDADTVKDSATHVKAVADARARAVVITAPADVLPQVRDLVAQLDIPTEAATRLRIFPLRYADATAIANQLTSLYGTASSGSSGTANTAGADATTGGFGGRGGRSLFFQRMQEAATAQNPQSSGSSSTPGLSEAAVVAVADTRTNAVIVSASEDTMVDIASIIRELDATPANVPRVYIYRLENADIVRAKEILDSMFEDLPSTSSSGSSSAARNPTTGRAGTTGANRNNAANTGGANATGGAANAGGGMRDNAGN